MGHKKVGSIEFGGESFQAEFNDAFFNGTDITGCGGVFAGTFTADAVDVVKNVHIGGGSLGVGYSYIANSVSYSVSGAVSNGYKAGFSGQTVVCKGDSQIRYVHQVLLAMPFTVPATAVNGAEVTPNFDLTYSTANTVEGGSTKPVYNGQFEIFEGANAVILNGSVSNPGATCDPGWVHAVTGDGAPVNRGSHRFFSPGNHSFFLVFRVQTYGSMGGTAPSLSASMTGGTIHATVEVRIV